MTVFDFVVLAILLVSISLGAWRGVFGEIIALVGWILAFFVAKAWGDDFANRFLTSVHDPVLRIVLGWFCLFLLVLVLMSLVRLAVRKLLKIVGMELSDRLLGVIFGLARGLAIVLIAVALAGMTSIPHEKWWRQAYLSAPLETAVLTLKPWLSADIAKRIQFR